MQIVTQLPIIQQEPIAKRLRELRNHKKLTQVQLAQYLGVTPKTYREWETGKYDSSQNLHYPEIGYCNLIALSKLYNVSIDYLVCQSDFRLPENDFIHSETGLSDSAIDSLRFSHSWGNHKRINTINSILENDSFIDFIEGYLRFNVSENKAYTAELSGIVPSHYREGADGSKYYDPTRAHFRLSELEAIYYLKIWDALKEMKADYLTHLKKLHEESHQSKKPDKE